MDERRGTDDVLVGSIFQAFKTPIIVPKLPTMDHLYSQGKKKREEPAQETQ